MAVIDDVVDVFTPQALHGSWLEPHPRKCVYASKMVVAGRTTIVALALRRCLRRLAPG